MSDHYYDFIKLREMIRKMQKRIELLEKQLSEKSVST